MTPPVHETVYNSAKQARAFLYAIWKKFCLSALHLAGAASLLLAACARECGGVTPTPPFVSACCGGNEPGPRPQPEASFVCVFVCLFVLVMFRRS